MSTGKLSRVKRKLLKEGWLAWTSDPDGRKTLTLGDRCSSGEVSPHEEKRSRRETKRSRGEEPSRDEASLHEQKRSRRETKRSRGEELSPRETKSSPHEIKRSPGETKLTSLSKPHEERERESARAGAGAGTRANAFWDLPEALKTRGFIAAWQRWLAHTDEMGKGITAAQAQALFERFSEWGPERATAALEHSLLKGWRTIHEPDDFDGQRGAPPGKPDGHEYNTGVY